MKKKYKHMSTNENNNNHGNVNMIRVMNKEVYYGIDLSEKYNANLIDLYDKFLRDYREEVIFNSTEVSTSDWSFNVTYCLLLDRAGKLVGVHGYSGPPIEIDLAQRLSDIVYPSLPTVFGVAVVLSDAGVLNETATRIANAVKLAHTLPNMVNVIKTFWREAPNTLEFMLKRYCGDDIFQAIELALIEDPLMPEFMNVTRPVVDTAITVNIAYDAVLASLVPVGNGVAVNMFRDHITTNYGIKHKFLNRFLMVLKFVFINDIGMIPVLWIHILYHNCRFFDSAANINSTIDYMMAAIERGVLWFQFQDSEMECDAVCGLGTSRMNGEASKFTPFAFRRIDRIKSNVAVDVAPFRRHVDPVINGLARHRGGMLRYVAYENGVFINKYHDADQIDNSMPIFRYILGMASVVNPSSFFGLLRGPVYRSIGAKDYVIVNFTDSEEIPDSNSAFAMEVKREHGVYYVPAGLEDHFHEYRTFKTICDNNQDSSPEQLLMALTYLLLKGHSEIVRVNNRTWRVLGKVYSIARLEEFSLKDMVSKTSCHFAPNKLRKHIDDYMETYNINGRYIALFAFGYANGVKRVNALMKLAGLILPRTPQDFNEASQVLNRNPGSLTIAFDERNTVTLHETSGRRTVTLNYVLSDSFTLY